MQKRATIGRTLQGFSSNKHIDKNTNTRKQVFTLISGKKVEFTLENIPYEKLESTLFVDMENNGRDQSALTEASLKPITDTIITHQYFPAIGRKVGDKIEILDGSRRLGAAKIARVGLDVLVPDEDIEAPDARHLTKTIQTAKEHSLRELGLWLIVEKNKKGLDQKQLAKKEGMSAAKVSRAIQCASVPSEMLSAFPIQSDLTYPDFKNLLDMSSFIDKENLELSVLSDKVKDDIKEADEVNKDDIKDYIIACYNKTFRILKKEHDDKLGGAGPKDVVIEKLWEFEGKNSFARKKTKKRGFSYEFGHIPRELQKKLDEAIKKTLEDNC
ncbi:ParB family protein [Shewanella surugensis]|uniref:ParB/RepB/Spo0J family partition protein n=1 Tax=Shewanella surugensis TaxID=212020 RepID=A0ABT0LJ83_9GAMM|nr:ParB family protein [Shewanella surugensis]MCL1127771.1 ParB/RepB/Spo0J family partition protein [Shewanella surugensis]